PVFEYVSEEKFESYRKIAYDLGFKAVASSALVRSSYLAETTFNEIIN
ncbi:MAG TPA: lipoyl synthase, partial [Candidatus Wallbacteria bacterium]|nr:lipoyl synthase [Candidatus Wallbacteria bacterium]